MIDPRSVTDQPGNGAPTATQAPAPAARPPRHHRGLVATLFVLATVLGILAVNAVWVNRQVLNTDNWTNTSSQLLANKQIQTAVAAYAVNQLFSSGVPQAEIKAVLPPKLAPVAGPVAAGLQQIAGQLAPKLLASAPVQAAWRAANRAASATLVKIVNGGGSVVSTNGGVVALDIHAIVGQLAAALGVEKQVAAAQAALKSNAGKVTAGAATLGITLPPASGDLVIMRSSQLKTVQDIAADIKGAALLFPLLALALFVLAVWLSKGRRRPAVRTTGWCLVGIGLFALLERRLAGDEVVNALVKIPSNKPAADQVWAIATTLLYDIAVAMIVYGLLVVVAAWVAGHTRLATALRRELAPRLREHPAAGYIAVYIALLLAIIWGPTPATRQLPYIILFIVLLGLGVHALRRQTAREFPDAQAGDTMRAVHAWNAQRRQPAGPDPTTLPVSGGRVAELERLAQLHDHGSLTDAEFAAQKAVLMDGS